MKTKLIMIALSPFALLACWGWKLGRGVSVNRRGLGWSRDAKSLEAFWCDEFEIGTTLR